MTQAVIGRALFMAPQDALARASVSICALTVTSTHSRWPADYVNSNPAAFSNAYFDFQWLKIYG